MPENGGMSRGALIFVALALLCIIVGAAAYLITGNKGIEERFSQAVGLGGGHEEGGEGGIFGFSIEGNIVVYAVILVLLIVACIILLKKFRI